MHSNLSIDTDPQQQEAASPLVLVVRSFLRYTAMKQVALLAALTLLPSLALASGFGWYVSIISWSDFNKDILEGSARRAREVVAAPQTSQQVKQYVQDLLDDEIYGKYCNAQGRHGTDFSPRFMEFYSVAFLRYAESVQRGRGISNTVFARFLAPHKPHVLLAADPRGNPYFILSPDQTEAAHTEVRRMNAEVKHPPEHLALARHLEGVLLVAASDRYPTTGSSLGENLRSATFFCGHD
jgi:hypothetical protein